LAAAKEVIDKPIAEAIAMTEKLADLRLMSGLLG
jgi:hypothetical protein